MYFAKIEGVLVKKGYGDIYQGAGKRPQPREKNFRGALGPKGRGQHPRPEGPGVLTISKKLAGPKGQECKKTRF